jgi:hypothetical protein
MKTEVKFNTQPTENGTEPTLYVKIWKKQYQDQKVDIKAEFCVSKLGAYNQAFIIKLLLQICVYVRKFIDFQQLAYIIFSLNILTVKIL